MTKLLALATLLTLAAPTLAAPPKKPAPKPSVKPVAKPGIKGAAQMTGGAIRFGEIFALKSGFTYQILSARYSLDAFECYDMTAPATDEKLLILTVAIKNNRREEDNYFGVHSLQAVDTSNQIYETSQSAYALRSQPGKEFGPSLKPGQGLGQGGIDPLEVVFKMPADARIVKLILKQGREGTSEEVLRFFIAGATEAEAGGKPDPKNLLAPLPHLAEKNALVPPGQYVPSWTFQFKLTGFSTADKKGDEDAPEGKRWIFASISIKNPMHKKQNLYEFTGGGGLRELTLIDSDGERYPASYLLKAKRDEDGDGELEPGEEKSYRVAFLVPKDTPFKSARLGASQGHLYLFDASGAEK